MSWSAVAGAAVSVVGGAIVNSGSKSASGAQASGASDATAEQRRQFDITQENNLPFLATGTAANQRLAQLLGLNTSATGGGQDWKSMLKRGYQSWFSSNPGANPDVLRGLFNRIDAANRPEDVMAGGQNGVFDFAQQTGVPSPENLSKVLAAVDAPPPSQAQLERSPDYGSLLRKFSLADRDADPVYQSGLQFGLDEGTRGINNRAMASGAYDSGATLKALTRFGNDYGSTKTNESYNRFTADNNNIYNKLAGISGTGQVASGQIQSAGQNSANNISNFDLQAGNARSAGIVGSANAWGGALQGVNSALNNYSSEERFKKIFGSLGGSGSTSSNNGYDPYYQNLEAY